MDGSKKKNMYLIVRPFQDSVKTYFLIPILVPTSEQICPSNQTDTRLGTIDACCRNVHFLSRTLSLSFFLSIYVPPLLLYYCLILCLFNAMVVVKKAVDRALLKCVVVPPRSFVFAKHSSDSHSPLTSSRTNRIYVHT